MLRQLKPLDIAEVLTVWKVSILWIHTVSNLETACRWNAMCSFECIEVTLVLSHFKWINLCYVLASLIICTDCYKFEADSILKSLLVDNILDVVLLTTQYVAVKYILLLLV